MTFNSLPGNSTINDLVIAITQLQSYIDVLTKRIDELTDKSIKPKRTKLDKIEQ